MVLRCCDRREARGGNMAPALCTTVSARAPNFVTRVPHSGRYTAREAPAGREIEPPRFDRNTKSRLASAGVPGLPRCPARVSRSNAPRHSHASRSRAATRSPIVLAGPSQTSTAPRWLSAANRLGRGVCRQRLGPPVPGYARTLVVPRLQTIASRASASPLSSLGFLARSPPMRAPLPVAGLPTQPE